MIIFYKITQNKINTSTYICFQITTIIHLPYDRAGLVEVTDLRTRDAMALLYHVYNDHE